MLCEPRSTSMLKAMGVCDVGLIEEFERRFGESLVWVLDCPARLCLSGEHLDYVPWYRCEVVTAASDVFRMQAVVAPRDDGVVRISTVLDGFPDAEFNIDELRVSGDWQSWLESRGNPPERGWQNYSKGAVARVTCAHPGLEFGFDCLFDSTIPAAGGSSSSSALVSLSLLAVLLSNGLEGSRERMVTWAGQAEWYVGTRGGSMDHATQLLCEEGATLRLEFQPLFSAQVKPGLPDGYALATVFTGEAGKSSEAMDAFNELVHVQQQVIPRCIPEGQLLDEHSDTEELEDNIPEVIDGMRIRERFRFVVREARRSRLMSQHFERWRSTLAKAHDGVVDERGLRSAGLELAMEIGGCFNAAFADTRDLLGTHTQAVEREAERLRSMDGVFGVKLMGAGFGGLLLAIVEASTGVKLDLHQLGEGIHILGPDEDVPAGEHGLAAVILCGGAGSRMKAEGVSRPKPLLNVLDGHHPSTRHVCERVIRSLGSTLGQLIVVVPPGLEGEYERELGHLHAGDFVRVITQPEPLGTGDAVLHALDHLEDGVRNVYVSFGSQPLVRMSTIRSSLAHHLSNNLAFTLPTTIRDHPYAPLLRGAAGEVVGSSETHLEGADMPERGETNIGAYWATRDALEIVLRGFHTDNWEVDAGRYATRSGEFGYPNEMVRGCLARELTVDGIPCADADEVVGIKTLEHLEFIRSELRRRSRYVTD